MNERTKQYACTDLANSERYADDWAGHVLYVPGIGFMIYHRGVWIEAGCGEAVDRAKRTMRRTYREAESAPEEFRKAIGEWAVKSEAEPRIRSMLELAKSDPKLVILPAKLDADPWLLNVLNGTIDLRTGKLRPHDPTDRLTKQCPVAYDPRETSPIFLQFVDRSFAGNEPLIAYVQKLLGMACTGDSSSQILPIFWGEGANGKSTLLGICQYILGDYAGIAADSLLTTDRQEHPTEIADLRGKRLVVASETESTSKLRMQLVKKLTGEDRLKGRYMHRDYFEFPRTHHIILQTNNKPIVREDSTAVWRRIKLVPFEVVIPANERDPQLLEKLKAEATGILSWLVYGCLAWQREGLTEPEAVVSATSHYREDSDPLKDFIEECCHVGAEYMVKSGTLREAYDVHCKAQGVHAMSGRRLTDRLTKLGATAERNHSGRFWKGIGLIHSTIFDQEEVNRDAS